MNLSDRYEENLIDENIFILCSATVLCADISTPLLRKQIKKYERTKCSASDTSPRLETLNSFFFKNYKPY